ncbi:pseudaminic acid cytidylyltransferase [Pelagibaculum spongiae]|uniref:Pseudaminic acid cytidylyltransferase n=1 Tax=Pelagibaculum spongiae TaxID=2080658 RepID=A0A2V1H1F0_9GAMM|nr:pseudaminic acid cytidylyltransferase [Pelagibaculum spongiae]PVZ70201.1 pseudaminic acid cytidylyltransferase [Pelagibaculum spongiae]
MKVAIIPARGGSKRIPRKNIKLFHGKPLIAYSIEAAIKSGVFDRIIVSTDDQEIADVAKSYGAEVPFLRPDTLSDDFATTAAVMSHAIDWVSTHIEPVEYSCCIYATAPFLLPDDICSAFNKLQQSSAEYCFSVASFPAPIQRALKLGEHGEVSMFQPEHLETRSQDLQEAWHDAGQFYWSKSDIWARNPKIFSEASVAYPLPRHRVQDIDTPEDWLRAEIMMKAMELA